MSNGKLEITPAVTAKERKEFIHFQWEVYRDDPLWVPPLISDRITFLDKDKHPFHRHSEVDFFIARRDGKPVGTVAAILNKRHNDFHQERVGFFGLFEVLRDQEAAEALLQTACDWVKGKGMEAIRGPENYSQNEEAGLLVDGWDGPPVILMTYNPRYYVDFIEGFGFYKAQDLLAYMLDLEPYEGDVNNLPPKLLRVTAKIQDRIGFTVRKINMRHFEEEVLRFKEVYNSAWEKNWGFVPMTDAEIEHTAHELRMMIDPDLIWMAEKDGEMIGAMIPLPDLNQALIRAYPRPGVPEWWTLIKFFWYWKVAGAVTTMRGFAGGVIEPYRGRGVDAVMNVNLAKVAIKRYKKCEMSWLLESNLPVLQTAEMFGAEKYRIYRVYEKKL